MNSTSKLNWFFSYFVISLLILACEVLPLHNAHAGIVGEQKTVSGCTVYTFISPDANGWADSKNHLPSNYNLSLNTRYIFAYNISYQKGFFSSCGIKVGVMADDDISTCKVLNVDKSSWSYPQTSSYIKTG